MRDRYDLLLDELGRELVHEEARAERAAAQRFLASLDRSSPEGEWFETLAEGFPSRLEAAIAYLREMSGASR
jgi:hypothetical protein